MGARAVKRRGFTLVEVLVVLGVVLTLLGLLLPSLAGARESARAAACASNVRQLQFANDLFANDHAGRYVPGAAAILENRQRWHGARASSSGPFDPAGGGLTPYLGDAGASAAVRACPTFAPALEALRSRGMGFESGCGGYGYNNAFVGVERSQAGGGAWVVAVGKDGQPMDTIGARRTRFVQPARTIAFADAALAYDRAPDGVIEYSFVEPRFWPDWPTARPDPSVHFRHGAAGQGAASANVAWLDGHVSGETMGESHSSGLYARDARHTRVGWFGREDDNGLFDYD